MKTLFFILLFIFSFNGFSQFEANEWGVILKQYIRTIESRKQFIENNPEIVKYTITSVCANYQISDSSKKPIDIRIDSMLLNNLPNFNKFKYKVLYLATYNEFHIANSEEIIIRSRFNYKKGTYIISFQYFSEINGSNVPISRYLQVP
jgi:hypothetical protein